MGPGAGRNACDLGSERERVFALFRIEEEARAEGHGLIAGVDEVGRGCLAGPVYAGAVAFERCPRPARPRRLEGAAPRGSRGPRDADPQGRGRRGRRCRHRGGDRRARDRGRHAPRDAPRPRDPRRRRHAPVARPLRRGADAGSRRSPAGPTSAATRASPRSRRRPSWRRRRATRAWTSSTPTTPATGSRVHRGYATPEHLAALRRHGPSPEHRLTFDRVLVRRRAGAPRAA